MPQKNDYGRGGAQGKHQEEGRWNVPQGGKVLGVGVEAAIEWENGMVSRGWGGRGLGRREPREKGRGGSGLQAGGGSRAGVMSICESC